MSEQRLEFPFVFLYLPTYLTCCDTYSTFGVDSRPLHGDGDAVEEDNNQHDVVKHLVGDDLIAQDPEPYK